MSQSVVIGFQMESTRWREMVLIHHSQKMCGRRTWRRICWGNWRSFFIL